MGHPAIDITHYLDLVWHVKTQDSLDSGIKSVSFATVT